MAAMIRISHFTSEEGCETAEEEADTEGSPGGTVVTRLFRDASASRKRLGLVYEERPAPSTRDTQTVAKVLAPYSKAWQVVGADRGRQLIQTWHPQPGSAAWPR